MKCSHACNQKKNHGGNPSSHGPIRTGGQFSSVSWQKQEPGEHYQQNDFTLKFNQIMIQRLESSGIVLDEPLIEV